MNLTIKPWSKNTYPLQGILIKGNDLKHWLHQLQVLEIDIYTVPVFAIPDTIPNSIWGCFVDLKQAISDDFRLQNIQFCQCIEETLFIPEFSTLYPKINHSEIAILFAKCQHIFHPEFGLFELESPIDWQVVLKIPLPQRCAITEPHSTAFRPQTIHKIEIKALPPEELLKNIEEHISSEKETEMDKPLNWKEKIIYKLLQTAFKNSETESKQIEKAGWITKLDSMISKVFPNSEKLHEKLEKFENDFEELERRNRSEMEKLMNMFKDNPEEALKYAIPIDNQGTSRGGEDGVFSMFQRWNSFGLFGNRGPGSGKLNLQDDAFFQLQQQYHQTATNFIKEKKYEKAAFVYMKLLKNNQMAASTLEDGKLYAEAAALYLKYLLNKSKAALCYEKGRMTSDAIVLYKELKMNEKVGDLYQSINNRTEALVHYNYVVEDYKANQQYVKASLLLRNKMNDKSSAQDALLTGWREGKDGFNCINNYFVNIEDMQILSKEIDSIYRNETNEENKQVFLKALKHEHKKDALIASQTKELAYEIISELARNNPKILNELTAFNKDTQLSKDITRYKMNDKRK